MMVAVAAVSFIAGAVASGWPWFWLGRRTGQIEGIRFAFHRMQDSRYRGLHVPH
jgi:hypothetical protein